jgi:glycosyltransferase involved in cell wall biosynthesis
MRAIFFNEGNLGTHVVGHGQLEQALRVGLGESPELEARFAGLTAMGRWSRAAAHRPLPGLTRAGLDPRTLRWHLVQSLRARRALARELRAWPADVAHVHTHTIAFAMGRTMRELPVALSVDTTVGDWWEMPAWRPSGRTRRDIAPDIALERRALERAALVLAWTDWTRRSVQATAPGANVLEHHPGIDLERYRPAPRRERERTRVLFVGGRFTPKGGEDLLEALAPELGRTVELDIVTPAGLPARAGVRQHRLAPNDPALLDLQQQADVFCLPTYGDAVPWAVLEAMACGTPVLAGEIGGIPDLLDGGRAGVLITPGEPRVLREQLLALIESPARRAELAGSARARCESRYDARTQTRRMVELLGEMRATWPSTGSTTRRRLRALRGSLTSW